VARLNGRMVRNVSQNRKMRTARTVRCEEVTGIHAKIRLAPVPTSARQARRFVSDTLAQWGDEPYVEAASLLVSDLVTNAVLHAGSAVEVVVGHDGRHANLRIEVHDSSLRSPRMGGFDLDATSGRGLALVDAISDRWGVENDADGKKIWFEIERDDALERTA
jgi:anti-sigma regulatory factor (Ser/Thr protein kinase)